MPKPKPAAEREPRNDEERIGREQDRMKKYVELELGDPEHQRGPMERMNPRKFIPEEDYATVAYRPDLYVVEPAVIDALEAAKTSHDEDRIEKIRHHLRAMSWWAHGRTDSEVAAGQAEGFLREAQEPSSKKQTGFDYANPDMSEWTRVLNTLREIECRGTMVKKPTEFVEKKVIETWKDLFGQFKKKERTSDWPTTYPVTVDPPVLSEDVKRVSDRLTSLRHVRDQLYYQLLYPKHCMYAQKSKK